MYGILLELAIRFGKGSGGPLWRIGSGEAGLAADRLILRDARGLPFIPGSALKGIIRDRCEKLALTLGFPPAPDPHKGLFTSWGPQARSPIEEIFGTGIREGSLFFGNAVPEEQSEYDSLVIGRTAMNRVLRTARSRHLFLSEYAAPSVLRAVIRGSHPDLVAFSPDDPPYAYCLLIAGILAVERMGGDKSTGKGWVGAITIDKAEYNGKRLGNLSELFDYFDEDFIRELYPAATAV